MIELLNPRRSGKALIADCPCCGYKNGLSVTVKEGRKLYYCFAGCPQADLWAVVRDGEWDHTPAPQVEPKPLNKGLQDCMRRLWQSSLPAKGTLAETYLRARGIIRDVPPCLRFLPRHRHTDTETFWPVMLAAVTDCAGKLQAIHRTYLAHDGRGKASVKKAKKTLCAVGGYAAHLAKASERLAVTEGIETGLSVMQETGISTWAALSAGGIETLILPPLPLANEITICADNDKNGTGQRAAENAAQRWRDEGRSATIALPPDTGMDFNDILTGKFTGDASHAYA